MSSRWIMYCVQDSDYGSHGVARKKIGKKSSPVVLASDSSDDEAVVRKATSGIQLLLIVGVHLSRSIIVGIVVAMFHSEC